MRRSLKCVLLSMFGKASAIVAAFSVFHGATASAQGELCDNPNQYCTPMIQTVCVEKLYGAGAVAVQASTTDCRSQRRSYMACIASAAQLCSPPAKEERRSEKVHSSGCSSEDARELWSELRTSKVLVEIDLIDGRKADFMPIMRAQAQNSLVREKACHRFDICLSEEMPNRLFLYEVYDDRAAFEAHLATPHFLEFDAAVAGMIAAKSARILDLDANPA